MRMDSQESTKARIQKKINLQESKLKEVERKIIPLKKDQKIAQDNLDNASPFINPRYWLDSRKILLMCGGVLNNGDYEIFPMRPTIFISNNECFSSTEYAACEWQVIKTSDDMYLNYNGILYGYNAPMKRSMKFHTMTIQGMYLMFKEIGKYCGIEWDEYKTRFIDKGYSQIKYMDNRQDLRKAEPAWSNLVALNFRNRLYSRVSYNKDIALLKGFRNPHKPGRWRLWDDKSEIRQTSYSQGGFTVHKAYKGDKAYTGYVGHTLSSERGYTIIDDASIASSESLQAHYGTDHTDYTEFGTWHKPFFMAVAGGAGNTRGVIGYKRIPENTDVGSFITGEDIIDGMRDHKLIITQDDIDREKNKGKNIRQIWNEWFTMTSGWLYSRAFAKNSFQNIYDAVMWNLNNTATPQQVRINTFAKDTLKEVEPKITALEKEREQINKKIKNLKEKLTQAETIDFIDQQKPSLVRQQLEDQAADINKNLDPEENIPSKPKKEKKQTGMLEGRIDGALELGYDSRYATLRKGVTYLIDPNVHQETRYKDTYRRLLEDFPELSKELADLSDKHHIIIKNLKSLEPIPLDFLTPEEIVSYIDEAPHIDETLSPEEVKTEEKKKEEDVEVVVATIKEAKEKIQKVAEENTWQELAVKQYQYLPETKERPIEKSPWRFVYAPKQPWVTHLEPKLSAMTMTVLKDLIAAMTEEEVEVYLRDLLGIDASAAESSRKKFIATIYKVTDIQVYKDLIIIRTKDENIFLKGGKKLFDCEPEYMYGRQHSLIMDLRKAHATYKRSPIAYSAYDNKALKNIKKITILNTEELLLTTKEGLIFRVGLPVYGIKDRPLLGFRPLNIPFSGMYNNYPVLVKYGEGVLAPKLLQQVKSYGKYQNLNRDTECDLFDNDEHCSI